MMPCFADNLVDVHTYVVALSLKFLVKCIVWTGMEEVHCCFRNVLTSALARSVFENMAP